MIIVSSLPIFIVRNNPYSSTRPKNTDRQTHIPFKKQQIVRKNEIIEKKLEIFVPFICFL